MSKISCVYKIQSKVKPERIYIGSTVDFNSRRDDHMYRLRNNKHRNKKLQNHYNKYGGADMAFSIVVRCVEDDLMPEDNIVWLEQLLMWAYKKDGGTIPWFNVSPTAGCLRGVKKSMEEREDIRRRAKSHRHSPESKQRISDVRKGKKASAETRLKQSLAQKERYKKLNGKTGGWKLSDEVKEKLSRIRKGHKVSAETRRKIGDIHRGMRHTEETKELIRLKKTGKKLPPKTAETRERIRKSKMGHIVSPETREKIRISNIKYWENHKKNGH